MAVVAFYKNSSFELVTEHLCFGLAPTSKMKQYQVHRELFTVLGAMAIAYLVFTNAMVNFTSTSCPGLTLIGLAVIIPQRRLELISVANQMMNDV